jgi:N-acetylglucosamine-6-phosphate deacetylase
VGADQIVRQPGMTYFSGSALRPIDGVFRAAKMLSQPWQEVWDSFSNRPADFMGLRHQLGPGEPASFCLLRVTADNCLREVQVY